MRILPIITNPLLGINKNNQYDYSQNRVPVLKQPPQTDTVTFEARTRAKYAEPLRELM